MIAPETARDALRAYEGARQRQSFAVDLEGERERRQRGAAAVVDEQKTSWAPVDLAAVIDGGHLDEPPPFFARTDGACLLYRGKIHVFSGEPESCKGWGALHACRERLAAGEHVLYIDFEDVAATVVPRLINLGVEHEAIRERFHYVQPDEPVGDAAWRDLEPALSTEPTLAVIDGVTEALVVHGLDLIDNSDVAKWLALLPRRLTAAGMTTVQIDHVGRDREARGRNSIGAQHKLAGVDVHYTFDVVEPFGRGREGKVLLNIGKDRPGHVRQLADEAKRVAEMRLSSGADGSVRIEIGTPGVEAEVQTFRPTVLMERVSKAIGEHSGLTKSAIRSTVKGNNDYKDAALELLVAESYVEARREGQAHRHFSLRPFRGGEDE